MSFALLFKGAKYGRRDLLFIVIADSPGLSLKTDHCGRQFYCVGKAGVHSTALRGYSQVQMVSEAERESLNKTCIMSFFSELSTHQNNTTVISCLYIPSSFSFFLTFNDS